MEEHKITMLPMRKPLIVNSLGGEKKANHICLKVSLNIKGKNFEANLIVLDLMDIDFILRKCWVSACKVVIKYAQLSVLLTTPFGERTEYEGIQPAPEEDKNDLLEGVSYEDSKVDCEFLDVNIEERTPLEGINKIDDHAYANYLTKKGLNAQGAI